MATLSGFHVVMQKKQQLVSAWKTSELHDSLLAGRADKGGGHHARCKNGVRVTESVMVAGPGNERRSCEKKAVQLSQVSVASKISSRGEPVTAYRDQASLCSLASATLDRVSTRGGALLEDVSGDSMTTSERSRLESQWTMFLTDSSSTQEGGVREEEHYGNLEGEKKAVCSGKPKARSRRLEARRKRLSTAEDRPPIGAFTIFPRKRGDGKSDHKKVEGVQGYVSTYLREINKIDRLTAEEETMLSKIIRNGYLLKEDRKRLERSAGHELTKHQWADLLNLKVTELDAKLHEAELARDRMVMANLRLVLSVVKQYSCDGLEIADLIQEGTIGLLKGVEKFDHTRGYKLSTYVHWWIRQGVTRAIADHSRTVRLPVHVHDALGRIRRAKAKMHQDGDLATVENLGETLKLSNNQVMAALKVPKNLKSLDMQVGHQKNFITGDNETFHSLIADQQAENQPWTMVERAQLKGDVEKILNTHLCSREREILKLHFGMDSQDGYPMSLENISHRYGISRERVRQLERAAKQKLQTTRNGLDKYCGMLM